MPYAIRNSIILAVLLILIAGAGGSYIYFFQEPKIEELEAERERVRSELGDPEELLNTLLQVQDKVAALNSAWKLRPKTLQTVEVASATNTYLNEILMQSPELDLNVFTNELVQQIGCGYVRYHLAGQGAFASFMRLIQYLEFGPRLMKLVNMDVRELHTVDDELGIIEHSIQFDVDVLAYFSDQPPFADTLKSYSIPATRFASVDHNPFRSLVVPEVPPNTFDLPNVERSTLLAIMKGRAFISDQHNDLIMLSEGDEVYLGYLSKVMPERRQVLFLLNKGGIIERYMLTLSMDNPFPGKKRK